MASPTTTNDSLQPAGSAPATEAERLAATQKNQDAVSVYFARKVSKYLTPWFLKTPMTANQATALWGLLSLFNTFVIYEVLIGYFWFAPLVFALFFVVVVIDCVDGEIARFRGTASPIGGKLLDGVWHKATEYGLLVAYAGAAYTLTHNPYVFIIGLVLVSGEAMYTYVYERRLTVIRVYAKSTEYINPTAPTDLYRKDERWGDFEPKRKINAFKGLIQYKSVYFMMLLAFVSSSVLLAGVVLLMAYKHYAWIKLLMKTVNRPPQLASE
jgi:phosphatidylglycerophosphate synthase